MDKYRYQDDTNIDRLQLCYEEKCTFVGGPKDFHDVYSDGRFSCPFHLNENMVLGSEVEDIHSTLRYLCDHWGKVLPNCIVQEKQPVCVIHRDVYFRDLTKEIDYP